jgi:hypothetical protein
MGSFYQKKLLFFFFWFYFVKIFTELHRVFDKSFGAVNFFDIFFAAWKINVLKVKMIWFCFMIVQATHGWYFILGQIGHLGYMSSI